MQMRADANICYVKEEVDSSRVNQAYDKYVAVKDTATKKEKASPCCAIKHFKIRFD
jgi:hypothetical protein